MEDNEFEEGTIISHTDQGATILPQRTAERLMKDIRLEVTQKISPTENIKYGTEALNTKSTELERLWDIFCSLKPNDGYRYSALDFIVPAQLEASGQYLLGVGLHAFCPNADDPDGAYRESGYRGTVSNLIHWGERFFVFASSKTPQVLNRNNNKMGGIKFGNTLFRGKPSRHVFTTQKYLYYLSDQSKIVRIDQRLREVVTLEDLGPVQDFFVCPKTETITTLDGQHICRGTNKLQISKKTNQSAEKSYSILKKMYSDHFLVGETNENSNEVPRSLYLVHVHKKSGKMEVSDTYRIEEWIVITKSVYDPNRTITRKRAIAIENIRLLAPRQGISCFLVGLTQSLELFCEYNGKIRKLHERIEATEKMGILCPIWEDDTWLWASNERNFTSIKIRNW